MRRSVCCQTVAQARAEQIFLEALERSPSQRVSFLDQQCGDDLKLRELVESFLAADEAASDANFLESHFLAGATIAPHLALANPELPRDPASEKESGLENSRFRILSRYEQGGLGEVLIAHDRQLDREVAIKQIRPKWLENSEARERFIQEAEVTGRLEHPGIVPVYSMGTWDDGRPFYAMRFIQGTTLKRAIAQFRESTQHSARHARRLDLRGLLNRFVDVCNTIEYAHSRQILHRDIKPSNIMIGPYGETLVVDWGLAKRLDAPFSESMTAAFAAQNAKDSGSSQTQIGGAVGTPQYMSPEQAAGDLESIGIRTDVYLLGATLYQILTGVPPHEEESVSKLIDRVKRGILTRPRDVDPDVPRPLEAICLKAMATKVSDRYPSAARLSADIECWLADQSVSAYRDPLAVRLGRWNRQHRTFAMSGAVATVLLTVGSVIGSMLWSYQQSLQFRVEQDRNIKEAQLIASQQQRESEMRSSALNALDLSLREIRADRFSAASDILRHAAEAISEEANLTAQLEEINARAERLEKIAEFYRQAELSEQFNVISRDTQGILASTASLQAIGAWDSPDWWSKLPADDLTPSQTDQLRWDVYQQWLMLDGMLIKTIGTRLFGSTNASSTMRMLSALRRMGSGAGKREADAALVACDRIDLFRPSEAARWYRSIANYRLGEGRRLKGQEIGTPRNAPDAQKLGVLCMLSAMDPSFRTVFRDYDGKDATTAARDLFQRSASLRPDHYWTQISLGQMQYFIAEQEPQPTWQSYQPAVQTMGRCIAINPKSCFAFADRSSLFRFQWERMKSDANLPAEIRNQRAADLLKWSLQDAQAAYRLGSDQPWVGWTYGMALSAAGQSDEAVDVFLEASRRTFPLMKIGDVALIRADDIRGRSDAAEYASDMIEQFPDTPAYRILLASIRLNQEDHEEALKQIEIAISQAGNSPHAHAIRGMIRLHNEDIDGAAEDFRVAKQSDPNHLWACYGAAECDDAKHQHESALAGYQQAIGLATTDEHRAACLLGIGRVAAFLGKYDQAKQAVASAQQLQPACDVQSVAQPLLERMKQLRAESADTQAGDDLLDFLRYLSQRFLATRIEFERPASQESFDAPLLNGDFELDAFRYWSDDFGSAWRNQSGYKASARISASEYHGGNFALQLIGDASDGSGRQGSTGQAFPVPANCKCRLSVWAKSTAPEPGAVRLVIDELASSELASSELAMLELAMLELADGSYDWQEFAVEFQVGDAPDPTQPIFPLRLRLVSAGAAKRIWTTFV